MKQVNKDSYRFEKYSDTSRWASYYYQLKETLRLEPKSILEIGTGDGVFKNYILSNTDIEYTSIDVAEDLHPDVVGSVTKLPFKDGEFDIVCAFEVLEHIPFSDFEKALSEIRRVAGKYAVVSLPHFGPPIQFFIKIPFLPRVRFSFKLPYPREHVFNGQHYWEIGKRGYSSAKIRKILAKYFDIVCDYVPFENQYHHFYILKNEKNN